MQALTEQQQQVRWYLDQWNIDPSYVPSVDMASMTIHALECENIQAVRLNSAGVLEIEFYEDEQSTIQPT